MSEPRIFFVPDFYERFVCKADKCRANCCHGWSITVSMQDYFNLLSVPCSKRLREKLDVSLHLVKDADPQRYAQILPDWKGNCPLQQEDGLCALQCECGEKMLSSTCRYYPRGVRTAFDDECCLSGSCEGVLETMFARLEPIRFKRKALTFDMELPVRAEQEASADADRSIQAVWFAIMQDRTYSLGERLQCLGAVTKALMQRENEPITLCIKKSLAGFDPVSVTQDESLNAYGIQMEILGLMAQQSEGIRPLVQRAVKAFGMNLDDMGQEQAIRAHAQYLICKTDFEAAYPDWQIYFEHMLVNHIQYQGYPYSARHESIWDEYTAICAIYAALRALLIGCQHDGAGMDDFVDVCAAAFKLFDHSAFDHNAMVLLKRMDLDSEIATLLLSAC